MNDYFFSLYYLIRSFDVDCGVASEELAQNIANEENQ